MSDRDFLTEFVQPAPSIKLSTVEPLKINDKKGRRKCERCKHSYGGDCVFLRCNITKETIYNLDTKLRECPKKKKKVQIFNTSI